MDKNTLKTSFGKWISPINLKKLTTEAFLKLMLFAQLHETESLHAISDALLDEDFQKVLGFRSISASQLSRKNNDLDPSVLATIFLDLVHQIHQHHHRMKRVMPLKIIDSTTLPLNLTHYKWATFRKTKAGVKLHLRLVFMDSDNVYPDKAIMTTADEHDRNQL